MLPHVKKALISHSDRGVGEGTGICIHGEAFAKRIRPFPWLPLLLVVWPQYCWKTTSLSSHCSGLVRVRSPSAPFGVRRGQAGHLRSVFPKFPLLADEMPFSPLLPAFLVFPRIMRRPGGTSKALSLGLAVGVFPPGAAEAGWSGMSRGAGENPSTPFGVLTPTVHTAGDLWVLQDQPYFVRIRFSKTIFGSTVDDSHKR